MERPLSNSEGVYRNDRRGAGMKGKEHWVETSSNNTANIFFGITPGKKAGALNVNKLALRSIIMDLMF